MEIIVWVLAGLVVVLVVGGYALCRRWKEAAEAALAGRAITPERGTFGRAITPERRHPLGGRVSEIGPAQDFSEALIANTPDGFVVVDEQMTIVQVNEAFCRMTGRSRK